MSETIVSYGDNGINVLSPAPASGTGGALLLGNDQALSNAIDALNTKYLSLNGGTLTGALSINENFGNYGILNFCNNTGEVQLQEVYYGNSQKLKFLDASGNLLFSIGLNQSVNTNSNTLDDGMGNMAVAGTITSGVWNGTPIAANYVATLNQNTTGTAANITATSNSTLTTLSALSLPASQVAGLSIYAPLAGPAFTGNPTTTTPLNTSNNTQIASTAFVKTVVSSYLPLAGGTVTGATSFSGSGVVVSGTLTGVSGGNTQLSTTRGCTITGNSVIPSGTIASVYIPANATVTRWAVISTDGTTGSITFDIQQSALGSGLYTSMTGNSIVNNSSGGAYPYLSSQTTNSLSTLTNWTTSLTGGNYLVFVVLGTPASVKNVRLELTLVPR